MEVKQRHRCGLYRRRAVLQDVGSYSQECWSFHRGYWVGRDSVVGAPRGNEEGERPAEQ